MFLRYTKPRASYHLPPILKALTLRAVRYTYRVKAVPGHVPQPSASSSPPTAA